MNQRMIKLHHQQTDLKYRTVKYKIFSGEIPPTPLTRGGRPPPGSPPTRAFGTRKTSLIFPGRTTFQKPTTALRRRDPHQKQYVPHLRLGGHKKLIMSGLPNYRQVEELARTAKKVKIADKKPFKALFYYFLSFLNVSFKFSLQQCKLLVNKWRTDSIVSK